MVHFMGKAYPSVQIFKNPTLEKFTHVHPITPLIVWTPVIAYLIYLSFAVDHLPLVTIVAWVAAALFIWTLVEYLLHRYIFHFKPKNPTQEFIEFIIHGNHHEDPNDPSRLVMPPVAAIIIAIPLYLLSRMALGPVLVHPFFGAFLIGYLIYDYTHYAIHHFRPRTRFGKMVKQNHMAHHFVGHHSRWGVSSPLWDYVFGTIEEAKSDKKRVVRHGS